MLLDGFDFNPVKTFAAKLAAATDDDIREVAAELKVPLVRHVSRTIGLFATAIPEFQVELNKATEGLIDAAMFSFQNHIEVRGSMAYNLACADDRKTVIQEIIRAYKKQVGGG